MSTNDDDVQSLDAKPRRLHLIYQWTIEQSRRELRPFWIDLNDPSYQAAAT